MSEFLYDEVGRIGSSAAWRFLFTLRYVEKLLAATLLSSDLVGVCPSVEDVNLVAAGIRSAVLLDSRRMPRGSPPLAKILKALQVTTSTSGSKTSRESTYRSEDIASLGLLLLDDSSFLVNRSALQRRLVEILRPSHVIPLAPVSDLHKGGIGGPESSLPAPPIATIGARRKTAMPSGSPSRVSISPRDFALLDVGKSRVVPTICTDNVSPQLLRVLSCIFGDGVAGTEAKTDARLRDGSDSEQRGIVTKSAVSEPPDKQGLFGARTCDGARWFNHWDTKELVVDTNALRERLGNLGLPGLAGWLLEYPVIYCCPSSHRHRDTPGDEDGTFEDRGNCLSLAELTVYSLHIKFEKNTPTPQHDSGHSCQVLSFSVPQVVHPADGNVSDVHHDDSPRMQLVRERLSGLVRSFVSRIEARVANAAARYGWQRSHYDVHVSKRTETLCRVAL